MQAFMQKQRAPVRGKFFHDPCRKLQTWRICHRDCTADHSDDRHVCAGTLFLPFFCPMGAVFSLLPALPFLTLTRDRENCIKGCRACTKTVRQNWDFQRAIRSRRRENVSSVRSAWASARKEISIRECRNFAAMKCGLRFSEHCCCLACFTCSIWHRQRE